MNFDILIIFSLFTQDEEVHRKVWTRSPSGDENHNENSNIKQTRKQKKLKKDHINI